MKQQNESSSQNQSDSSIANALERSDLFEKQLSIDSHLKSFSYILFALIPAIAYNLEEYFNHSDDLPAKTLIEIIAISAFSFAYVLLMKTFFISLATNFIKSQIDDIDNILKLDYKKNSLTKEEINQSLKKIDDNLLYSANFHAIKIFGLRRLLAFIFTLDIYANLPKTPNFRNTFYLTTISDAFPVLESFYWIIFSFTRSHLKNEPKKVITIIDDILKGLTGKNNLKSFESSSKRKLKLNLWDYTLHFLSGKVGDYLDFTLIKTPFQTIKNYQTLSGPHFYFILSFLLNKHIPVLENFATDDEGTSIGCINKNGSPVLNSNKKIVNFFLQDLNKINILNDRITKKIKKFNKQFQENFQLMLCFSEVNDFKELFKVNIDEKNRKNLIDKKFNIDDENCINYDDFFNYCEYLVKSSNIKENNNNDLNNYQDTSLNSTKNRVSWFFTTKEKEKTRKGSDSSYISKANKKKFSDFYFVMNDMIYNCDNIPNIKLLSSLSLDGPPTAIGIFRISNTMMKNDEQYRNFENIFIQNNKIGGKHRKCIKHVNAEYFNFIKHKFPPDIEVKCELHDDVNTRIFGIKVASVSGKFNGEEFSSIDLLDFSFVDEDFHLAGNSNQYTQTKAKDNPVNFQNYLKINCDPIKVEKSKNPTEKKKKNLRFK